jgi:hypothetical protein
LSGVTYPAGSRYTAEDASYPQPWQAVTLLNSWVNHGGGNAEAQVRLRDPVTVDVVGMIQSGTISNGTVLFDLPSGFGPSSNQIFYVSGQTQAYAAELVVQAGSSPNVIIGEAASGLTNLNIGFSYYLDC